MFHSLFLSIAFFLLLESKNKKGSEGMGEITLSILKWERGKMFFVHLGFVWVWHLDYCFQVDVWWENEDVVFLMVREKKNKIKEHVWRFVWGWRVMANWEATRFFMNHLALWWVVVVNKVERKWVFGVRVHWKEKNNLG